MDPNITAYSDRPTAETICPPTSITRSQGNLAHSEYRFQREMTEHIVCTREPRVPLAYPKEEDLALDTETYLWFKRTQNSFITSQSRIFSWPS